MAMLGDAGVLHRTVVFILSADHSGSTWLGYVLGSHPDAAFLGEYYRAWEPGLGQPCTTCASRGLAECEVLHGIETVPRDAAFAWAFQRSQRSVLVDTSKVTYWAAAAMANAGRPDLRLVHLLRDPRGVVASRARRSPSLDVAATVEAWLQQNNAIRSFANGSGVACRTVLYDDLARDRGKYFSELFVFCGLRFKPCFLDYWTATHHGFAGNGATSQIVPGGLGHDRPAHLLTGDDGYYQRQRGRHFADDRWKTDLTPAVAEAVAGHPGVRALFEAVGRHLTPEGIAPVAARRRRWWNSLR